MSVKTSKTFINDLVVGCKTFEEIHDHLMENDDTPMELKIQIHTMKDILEGVDIKTLTGSLLIRHASYMEAIPSYEDTLDLLSSYSSCLLMMYLDKDIDVNIDAMHPDIKKIFINGENSVLNN